MLGESKHPRAPRDFYPTIDENVSRAIARFLLAEQLVTQDSLVWECAGGDWAMGKVLEEYFKTVMGSDIAPQPPLEHTFDFLKEWPNPVFDAIITNPPYGVHTTKFMERGLFLLRNQKTNVVAMLARNELDSAHSRAHLFGDCPEFYAKLTLLWRPRWIRESVGSPRHNYAWYVWTQKTTTGAHLLYSGRSFGQHEDDRPRLARRNP
jgi:hypothetical protein